MKYHFIMGILAVMSISMSDSRSETLVSKLLADYEKITTLTCELRKDVVGPAGSGRRLSRIYFQRPDMLHVDNATPIKRRIVADGKSLYSYIEGDPKGFYRPIKDLDFEWLVSLRNVPGSAVEHLLKIGDATEVELPPTEDYQMMRGYQTERLFVVLGLDEMGRLATIQFYASAEMKKLTAQYIYRNFTEPVDGVWLSTLHEATLWANDQEIRETTRISNLVVNQPIAPSLFIPSNFFKGIDFASRMEEIYPSKKSD